VNLTCPHCGFQRELPADRLPAVPVRVTCPRCREQFPFVPPAPAPSVPTVLPAPATAAAEEAAGLDAAQAAALPKAGFWIRVVASLVDSTLVSLLQFIFGTALVAAAVALTGGGEDHLGMVIAWSFGPALGVLYYVGFTGYCGQTPGKMALRIKVIRSDGNDIGYGTAFLRETVAKFLSALILGIGYLMVAFDEQKQGLHDRLVKTYVIKL